MGKLTMIMWMLAVIVGCGVPQERLCGDYIRLDVEGRLWDYDWVGNNESLLAAGTWEPPGGEVGYVLTWDLLDEPDAADVEDRDPTGRIEHITWYLSCDDGTVRLHEQDSSGEDWVDEGEHTPWTRTESYEPPPEVWIPAKSRASGWLGTTDMSCTSDTGDCSESLDWDVELTVGDTRTIGSTEVERLELTGTNFPFRPLTWMTVIPDSTVFEFEMRGEYWLLDSVHDPSD